MTRLILPHTIPVAIITFLSFTTSAQQNCVEIEEDVLAALYTNSWEPKLWLNDAGQRETAADWSRDFPRMLQIWWEVLLETSDEADEQHFLNLSKALTKSLDEQDETNHTRFKQILLHAYRARFDLMQDHYVSGVGQLNTCIDLIEDSFAQEDEYVPFKLTSGLYHYFIAYAYDTYPLLRPYLLFLPDGDREKGLRNLEFCAQSDDLYLQTEARYFLMRIYFDLEGDHAKAQAYCDQLISAFPQNLLFQEFNLKLACAAHDQLAVQRIKSSYHDTVVSSKHWTAAERSVLEQRIAHLKP